ncbi:MAG: hypothetical protein JSS41_05485, partial [Proteobacteria bacterium]|nr:hypothetical protein [Pseudomonadota bacterium]
QPEHARGLAKLMRGFNAKLQRENAAKVNLIPFNPFPGTGYTRPPEEDIRQFQTLLMHSQVLTTVRRTRGDDIDAACGQLKGRVLDRGGRQARFNRTLAAHTAGNTLAGAGQPSEHQPGDVDAAA